MSGEGKAGEGNQSFKVHRLAAAVETLTCHITQLQSDKMWQGDCTAPLKLAPAPRICLSLYLGATAVSGRELRHNLSPLDPSSSHRREACWHLKGIWSTFVGFTCQAQIMISSLVTSNTLLQGKSLWFLISLKLSHRCKTPKLRSSWRVREYWHLHLNLSCWLQVWQKREGAQSPLLFLLTLLVYFILARKIILEEEQMLG